MSRVIGLTKPHTKPHTLRHGAYACRVTKCTRLSPSFYTRCDKKLGGGVWERGYNLAISAPFPSARTTSARWSTNTYDRLVKLLRMPSLTLLPAGWDRSTIRRHFPGACGLGITPKGLTWRSWHAPAVMGPRTFQDPSLFECSRV